MKTQMVLTSRDVLGNPGRKTGFWLEEGSYFNRRRVGLCSVSVIRVSMVQGRLGRWNPAFP
ncbi:MAG: hypothetical protein WBM24_09450 [Candidatus Sulfotelmatobacter sp.]